MVASVKTLSGRVVATVGSKTRSVRATTTALHWNGRAQDGTALPAGSYLVEVSARSNDGQSATVRQAFMTLR